MKTKTYDPNRVDEHRRHKPDGHDDGAGNPVPADRIEELGEGVPFWYFDDGVPEPEDEQK